MSRHLGSFAAVTHELRAPLHAILGLAELLADSDLGPRERDLARSIQRQGEAMQSVIDDVLELARIDAGQLEVVVDAFAPRSLIDEVAATFAPSATAKGLKISTRIADDVPRVVRADRQRLRQILVNLVSNAVKYTEVGSVSIDLLEAGGQLRILVADTGPGIPDSVLPDLFDAFTQVDRSHQLKGTGLGLSITRQLIDLLDGQLFLSSSEAGTTFSVVVPYGHGRRSGDGPTQDDARPGAAPEQSDSRTVLVVDDSDVNRLVAVSQLERLGHTALVAADGPAALALLASADVDLVLMDWHMPEMDGLEVIRRYRTGGAASEGRTPIVMMTASVSGEARRTCLDAGADGFLPKPVTIADLRNCLSEWFAGERAEPEPPEQVSTRTAVDRRVIDKMVEDLGGADAVHLVITTFLDDLGTRRGELRSTDPEAATRAAHTLKSTTRLLGAAGLSELLAEAETRLGSGTEAPVEWDALDPALDRVADELRTISAELAA